MRKDAQVCFFIVLYMRQYEISLKFPCIKAKLMYVSHVKVTVPKVPADYKKHKQ